MKPNYIDLTRTAEYFSTVKDNYVVLALLSAFFGLYLLTLIWAWYSDRKAMSRVRLAAQLFLPYLSYSFTLALSHSRAYTHTLLFSDVYCCSMLFPEKDDPTGRQPPMCLL